MALLPTMFQSSRLTPASFLRDLERTYERMLQDLPTNGGMREFPLDIEEEKERYVVTAELPGVEKQNVEILFQEGVLTIQTKQIAESERKDKNYIVRERSHSYASRSVSLPLGDDRSEVTAEMKDGVLTIYVPKSQGRQAKRIAIK